MKFNDISVHTIVILFIYDDCCEFVGDSLSCPARVLRVMSCDYGDDLASLSISLNDLPTSVIIVCNIITKKQATRMKLNDTKPTILYLLSSTQQTSKHEMDKNPVSSKYSYFFKKQIKNPIHTLTDKIRRKWKKNSVVNFFVLDFEKNAYLTWLDLTFVQSARSDDDDKMTIFSRAAHVLILWKEGSSLRFNTLLRHTTLFIYFLIKKH